MSSRPDPDDAVLSASHARIEQATGLTKEDRIVTSRDKGRDALPGRDLPAGMEQKLFAVALPHKMLAFETRFEPNVTLPSHAHAKAAVFRVVRQGSVFYGDVELKAGDWMYVPPGASYELRSGAEPCWVWHMYIGPFPIIIPMP